MISPVLFHRAKAVLALGLATFFFTTVVARAGTMVEIETPVGTMTLDLYDDEKPLTVANFLNYIQSGRYQALFAHRLDPGFVLQSGGYTVALPNNSVVPVPTDSAIAIGPLKPIVVNNPAAASSKPVSPPNRCATPVISQSKDSL